MSVAAATSVPELLVEAQRLVADGDVEAASTRVLEAQARLGEVGAGERGGCASMVSELQRLFESVRDELLREHAGVSERQRAHDAYGRAARGR